MRIKTDRGFTVTVKPKTQDSDPEFVAVAPGDRSYSKIDPNDPFVRKQIKALAECGIIEIDFDASVTPKKKAKPAAKKSKTAPKSTPNR